MSIYDDETPVSFDLPKGGRLAPTGDAYPKGVLGNIWGLTPADPWRLRQAREHFIEGNAEDFDVQGEDVIDKATGKTYRIAGFDPAVSDNPTDSGVEVFFVTWDERLVYLKPVGSQGRAKSVFVGNLTHDGRRA